MAVPLALHLLTGGSTSFVVSPPMRDLLICAKHLFVAAKLCGMAATHLRLQKADL
jgi:hypothetical protein